VAAFGVNAPPCLGAPTTLFDPCQAIFFDGKAYASVATPGPTDACPTEILVHGELSEMLPGRFPGCSCVIIVYVDLLFCLLMGPILT
jgi:hypothetical protein